MAQRCRRAIANRCSRPLPPDHQRSIHGSFLRRRSFRAIKKTAARLLHGQGVADHALWGPLDCTAARSYTGGPKHTLSWDNIALTRRGRSSTDERIRIRWRAIMPLACARLCRISRIIRSQVTTPALGFWEFYDSGRNTRRGRTKARTRSVHWLVSTRRDVLCRVVAAVIRPPTSSHCTAIAPVSSSRLGRVAS